MCSNVGSGRKIKTMFWPQMGKEDLRMQNPYWIAYRNLRTNDKKRYMLSASLSYDITDWLNISGPVFGLIIPVPNMNKNYMQVPILLLLKVVHRDFMLYLNLTKHKCMLMRWQI